MGFTGTEIGKGKNTSSRGLKHIPALDGLRGLAVALVVGVHLHMWRYAYHPAPTNVVAFLQGWLDWGWCGVNIFFVLSGFLITGILLETRNKPGYFRNFYGRRALRIFPLYFGMVLALAVLARFWHGSDALNLYRSKEWWFFTYTWNIFPFLEGDHKLPGLLSNWMGHFWSLCVEEHFYLVWPFVIAAVARSSRLLTVCGVAYLGSVLCKIYFVRQGWLDAAYFSTPTRFDALVLGAAAAIFRRAAPSLRVVNHVALWMAGIAALCCGLALASRIEPWNILPVNLLFTSYGVDWLAAGFILLLETSQSKSIALCLTATPKGDSGGAAANVLRIPIGHEIFTHPILVRLGVISYGVYVFHIPVQRFFIQVVWPKIGALRSLPTWADFGLYTIVTTGITLLAAELSWRFFETPILSLKDRWFGKGRATRLPQPMPGVALAAKESGG